jgi:hypothetical protein
MFGPWCHVRSSAETGSTPLELVVYSALLLVPIAPAIQLGQLITDQVAAESIARNSLRSAVLTGKVGSDFRVAIRQSVNSFAATWGKPRPEVAMSCESCGAGDLVTLTVFLGQATAVQSASLEPK